MRNLLMKTGQTLATLRLGIAPTGMALLKTSGLWKPRTEVIAECTFDHQAEDIFGTLATCLQRMLTETQVANLPLTVILADHWARLYMVTPPRNAGSLEDCRAAALMRFQSLYGESSSGWQIHADWRLRNAFLACALPDTLLVLLQSAASRHRLTLLAIMPQFVAAWNRWNESLNGTTWFGTVHGTVLTCGAVHQNHLRGIYSSIIPDSGWKDPLWIASHLSREALRLNLPEPDKIQVCGQISGWPDAVAISSTCVRLDATESRLFDGSATYTAQLAYTGGRA